MATPGTSANPYVVETEGDYTSVPVTTAGPSYGLPATITWTSGPRAGKTTTYTYDATTGAVTSKVTA